MRRRRRWLIGCIAAASLAATVVPAALAAGQVSQPNLCTRNRLNVRQVGLGTGGAAGTIHETWAFTKHTAGKCQMHGYPELQMYRKGGRPIPTTTKDTLSPLPNLITLAKGHSAVFSMSYNDVQHGTQPCPASFVLRITAPHTNASLFVPARVNACSGVINVSAVSPPFVTP
jgi:hypothetical protein